MATHLFPSGTGKKGIIVLLLITTQSCYHYRVLNSNNDPATEYQKKVLWSYCWGLVNKPKDFTVPNCTNSNGIDEVLTTTNFGYTLLTVVTLGIVCPIEVKWKCHKPCPKVGDL